MQRIVINTTYGGFFLTKEQVQGYVRRARLMNIEFDLYYDPDDIDSIPRDCPVLVQMVEEMPNGNRDVWGGVRLKVVEIPDDVEWHIQEYDGKEWIAENHRTWESSEC